jgi:hypothetical protein
MRLRGNRSNIPIHEVLNDMVDQAPASDFEFYQFANMASKALRGEELRKGAKNGDTTALIELLLRNRPLERAERKYFGMLLAGELKPRVGRPSRNPSSDDQVIRTIAKALRPRVGVDSKSATNSLVGWLLSERPLELGERVILAQLMAGQMNPTGPPGHSAAENSAERRLIYDALDREACLKAALNLKERAAPFENAEAAKWAAGWIAKRRSRGFKSMSADDVREAAAVWAAKDPRARGNSDTLRKKMQAWAAAWKAERQHNERF